MNIVIKNAAIYIFKNPTKLPQQCNMLLWRGKQICKKLVNLSGVSVSVREGSEK